jgi:hypothetical protein
MEAFQQHPPDRVPRRVFLIMPFAFAGLVAISRRSEHRLPDPRQGGAGDWIALVVLSDNGRRRETIRVQKIVKSDAEWQRELTPEEYAVARKKGTERAFTGRYWNSHEAGIYRCACCGTDLFLSNDKFERQHRNGSKHVHGTHRSAVRQVRRTLGPPVSRRSRAHRPALLHQLSGAAL